MPVHHHQQQQQQTLFGMPTLFGVVLPTGPSASFTAVSGSTPSSPRAAVETSTTTTVLEATNGGRFGGSQPAYFGPYGGRAGSLPPPPGFMMRHPPSPAWGGPAVVPRPFARFGTPPPPSMMAPGGGMVEVRRVRRSSRRSHRHSHNRHHRSTRRSHRRSSRRSHSLR